MTRVQRKAIKTRKKALRVFSLQPSRQNLGFVQDEQGAKAPENDPRGEESVVADLRVKSLTAEQQLKKHGIWSERFLAKILQQPSIT